MRTLDEIAIQFKTDKASAFNRTYAQPHDYCRHLERFFKPLRDKGIRLLEIGVGGGESIQTWLEYFPFAKIYGVDINHSTNPWNTPGSPIPRYTFIHGDQSNKVFWQSFIKVNGGDWDIVIDDGSHVGEHIITTFYSLFPHVSHGGIYEIEDLGVALGAAAWLRSQSEHVHVGASDIDSIHFSKELAILVKK
jgi:hypothetical protein